MILGVLLLTATIHRTFNDLFDSVYGRTDLVVSGVGGDAVRHSALDEVRRTPGVEQAEGVVFSIFTLVDRSGAASTDAAQQLNVAGESTRAAELADARTVAGRRPRHGLEIDLQRSWADANQIELGDRVRLATPPASSDCVWWACSSSRPAGLRRAGLRHDAARPGAPGDGQAARLGRGGPGGRRRRGDDLPRPGSTCVAACPRESRSRRRAKRAPTWSPSSRASTRSSTSSPRWPCSSAAS